MSPDKKHLTLKSSVFGLISVLGLWSSVLQAQIHRDSSLIIAWANEVSIQRGYINISDTTATDQGSNRASAGDPINATGKADGSIVSLGDGGIATYTLDSPLSDVNGPDFAVFENGFKEQTPPYLWFLELAVVELSSDGETFVRFPAISSTQTATQVLSFGQLQPDSLHNLAGKYPLFEGTPFDLIELKDSSNIDIHHITHIRIIDVVGSLDNVYGTPDSNGNMINDPFPTPFWSGGFDLDAVAILGESTGIKENLNCILETGDLGINVFPNPALSGETISIQLSKAAACNSVQINIIDQRGRTISSMIKNLQSSSCKLQATIKNPGVYFVVVQTPDRKFVQRLIVK